MDREQDTSDLEHLLQRRDNQVIECAKWFTDRCSFCGGQKPNEELVSSSKSPSSFLDPFETITRERIRIQICEDCAAQAIGILAEREINAKCDVIDQELGIAQERRGVLLNFPIERVTNP